MSLKQNHRHNKRLGSAEDRLDTIEAEAAALVVVAIPVIPALDDCAANDATAIWGPVPAALAGYVITAVAGCLGTAGAASGSETMDIGITNRTQSDAAVLSTKLKFASAAVVDDGNAVIDAAEDDLTEGDVLEIDISAIHLGTAAKGLTVMLTLTKP